MEPEGRLHGVGRSDPCRSDRARAEWASGPTERERLARYGASAIQEMIPAVVLAAGASTRMGRPKALLLTDRPGETFLARIVSTLRKAQVDDVIVVIGGTREVAEAARELLIPPPRVIENPRTGDGQLSSLQCALSTVDRPGVRAILVTLVDLPLVSADTVRAVLRAYRDTGAPIVRPAKGARHGHPVIFDRSVWEELRRADPATGARQVLQAHRSDVLEVPVTDEGAFQDIDTPEDYERLFGRRP